MEALHLPDNIKVHFAACEVQNQFVGVNELGVRYGLYTAFPFVERMVFGKSSKSPIMPLSWQKDDVFKKIPAYIMENEKHVIQDSGLFTLMFGSQKGKKGESLMIRWYDALVRFTRENAPGVTCVEVDCQKVLGVSKAWEFRERMRNDLPNNRIINVFHLEDGRKGLDRLVSDIVGDIRSALGESNPPLGIALVMEGEHLCKSMRGVKKSGKMTTSYLTGIFKDGPARSEFLEIAGRLLK